MATLRRKMYNTIHSFERGRYVSYSKSTEREEAEGCGCQAAPAGLIDPTSWQPLIPKRSHALTSSGFILFAGIVAMKSILLGR